MRIARPSVRNANRPLARHQAPAATAAICDSRGASPSVASGGSGPWHLPTVDGQVDGRRHPGINVASSPQAMLMVMYLDGHAKFTNPARSVARPGNIWTVRGDV